MPAGDLVNRLRKNMAKLAKWRRREGVSCYRLYDADLPEYNAAVDVYGEHAVVAEYEAPAHVDPDRAAARRIEIASAVATVLELPPDRLHMKTRRRQRGAAQYEREAEAGPAIVVEEAGHRFRIELGDYLDTGLFLDHRITRRLLAQHADGARFLNLFGYTGTATVYVARAGARSTTTVDLSRTYLDWAQANFDLNDIRGPQHRLVRADVLRFVEQSREQWDLVFLDPPTFSNSKSMQDTFDVQRDHAELIAALAPRLAPGGRLLFSTNRRRFTLDPGLADRFAIEDITKKTTPPDFDRRPPHHAWWLRRGE
jgi:23S rRNA (guanine2445-N2)-methyltransferase / 23S rRNA (guanine2069-N7)-methyltransferase